MECSTREGCVVLPTIKEIAQIAGVSRGTVDRVLNNRGSVNLETAERILNIANALNYTPNLAGKRLAIAKKQLRFGYVLFDTETNPFFKDVVSGIEERRESFVNYGIRVDIRQTEMSSPESQISAIEDLESGGLDGLAIIAINHPLVVDKLKDLSSKGVPIVTANSDIPDCGRIAYVGSDDYKSGQTAGGLMRLISPGDTSIGIIIGSPWVLCDEKRVTGYKSRIQEESSRFRVVETIVNHSDEIESYAKTRDFLERYPEVNALYLSAAGVSGACRAVSDLGRKGKIKVISHDTIPSTCSLIEDGSIVATIEQQPFIQGAKPLDILLDYLGMGIPPEKEIFHTKIEIKILENLYNS